MTDRHDINSGSREGNLTRYSRAVGSFFFNFLEQAPVGPIDGFHVVSPSQTAAKKIDHPAAFDDVMITRIIQEAGDCRSFEFDTAHMPGFEPRPGQFIPIRVNIDGQLHERCYAVSSLVARGETPRFTVKRVPSGLVSNWCHDTLKRGMTVSIGQPAGQFKLNTDTAAPLLFMAGGIGIAPILPMFKEALLAGNHFIKMMIFDRDETSAPFLQTLREAARRHAGRVEVAEIYTGSTGTVPPGVIERHVSGFTDANLYVCGPVGFTELAECAAMTAGLAKDRIFINEHARIAPDRPSMD